MSDTPNPEQPIIDAETPLPPDDTGAPFAERFAHFLTRTATVYAKAPLSLLSDRGIQNRLLENLVEYLPDGAIIGGGFLTQVILEEDNATDIDLFFTSEKAFRDTVALIQRPPKEDTQAWAYSGYKPKDDAVFDLDKLGNSRFITFVHPKRPALQLLRMVWYDSPEHVIDSFDLTVVQFAADKSGLTYNPVSFIDLSRKRLVLHRMQFCASTLRRLIKYAAKGFYACPGSLAHICQTIQDFKGPMDANAVVYVD